MKRRIKRFFLFLLLYAILFTVGIHAILLKGALT